MGCLCMGFSWILILRSHKYIYFFLSLWQINSRSRSNAWWNFTIHMQGSNCVSFYGYKHIQWVHCCCWDFSLQGNGCDIFLISIILFIWYNVAIIFFETFWVSLHFFFWQNNNLQADWQHLSLLHWNCTLQTHSAIALILLFLCYLRILLLFLYLKYCYITCIPGWW